MSKNASHQRTGHVGRRGTIVLPAAIRRRYGLTDGSLYISEEREEGILIRRAVAIPMELEAVRTKVRQGSEELDRGEGLSGEQVETELKALSHAFRARNRKRAGSF